MPKVICVHPPCRSAKYPHAPIIEVGDILEVKDVEEFRGKSWYHFVGISDDYAYGVELFAPISGISNEEIEEENQEQEASHMDRVWNGIVRELDKMDHA